MKSVYGYELVMDLRNCDGRIIGSKKHLQTYADKLCRLIKMKKYGKALISYFGEKGGFTKGYTLVQLIETSSITAHFSDSWNTAYINVFSCKKFDSAAAEEFTRAFFKAKTIRSRTLTR